MKININGPQWLKKKKNEIETKTGKQFVDTFNQSLKSPNAFNYPVWKCYYRRSPLTNENY